MAEFQVVAKELERMCNTYHALRGICGTDECPLYCEDLCYAQAMVHVHGDDACNLEKAVMAWAAEHPEPVYPTWGELFVKQSGFVKELENAMNPACEASIAIGMFRTPIPADLAQKLEIEPKEG
mgnify:CR=1 FL=1